MAMERPNLPVTADSSAETSAAVSMLRGALLPLVVAAIGPSASHAPMRPSADGTIVTSPPASAARGHAAHKAATTSAKTLLLIQRLREHARSILEHHLDLLPIDNPNDVSVTKFPVPNEIAVTEGLRCSIRLE